MLKVAQLVKDFPSFNTMFHKPANGSILRPAHPPRHPHTVSLQYPTEYYPIYAPVT